MVAKWALPGEPWEGQALDLKDKLIKGEVKIHEPLLLVYEVANLLYRASKSGRIRLEDAVSGIRLLGKLGFELHGIDLVGDRNF